MLVWNNKAACYLELKDFEKAHQTIDDAIEKYNSLSYSEKDPKHLAKLLARKGWCYFLQNKVDDALNYYSKSLLEDRVPIVED